MYSKLAVNKYLHTVASCWILLIQSHGARNHEYKIHWPKWFYVFCRPLYPVPSCDGRRYCMSSNTLWMLPRSHRGKFVASLYFHLRHLQEMCFHSRLKNSFCATRRIFRVRLKYFEIHHAQRWYRSQMSHNLSIVTACITISSLYDSCECTAVGTRRVGIVEQRLW